MTTVLTVVSPCNIVSPRKTLLELTHLQIVDERAALEELLRIGVGEEKRGNGIDPRGRQISLMGCTLPDLPQNLMAKRFIFAREFVSEIDNKDSWNAAPTGYSGKSPIRWL